MHSAWFRSTFLRVLKFPQIKEGGPNFWGEPILQKVRIIWSPLLYFNFKIFLDPNSSLFIRFQCILHGSGVPFSGYWKFYKLKRGDRISGENQFCRKSELLGPPFSISILNAVWTQILHHAPRLKVDFFSEPPKYESFSSLIPCYLLKVTRFLDNFPVWILSYDREKYFCL